MTFISEQSPVAITPSAPLQEKLSSLLTFFKRNKSILVIVLIAITLPLTLFLSQHATKLASHASSTNILEPEAGTLTGNVSIKSDTTASGGQYVMFGQPIVTPTPTPAPISGLPTACNYPYKRLVHVSTTTQLNTAVASAIPGDMIVMADGIYAARTTITISGTATDMITLCGNRAAKIAGNDITGGDVVALKASYWNLSGFSATGSVLGIHVVGGNHQCY